MKASPVLSNEMTPPTLGTKMPCLTFCIVACPNETFETLGLSCWGAGFLGGGIVGGAIVNLGVATMGDALAVGQAERAVAGGGVKGG